MEVERRVAPAATQIVATSHTVAITGRVARVEDLPHTNSLVPVAFKPFWDCSVIPSHCSEIRIEIVH